jgi:hypothetical protein
MIHIHNRRERSVTKHALPANETKRVCSVTKHTLPANETIYARLFFKVPQGEAAYVVGSIATIDNKLRTHHYVYAPALVSWWGAPCRVRNDVAIELRCGAGFMAAQNLSEVIQTYRLGHLSSGYGMIHNSIIIIFIPETPEDNGASQLPLLPAIIHWSSQTADID